MTISHLGGGVYVEFDGYSIVLTAEHGLRVTNRIALEPEVCRGLVEWERRLLRKFEKVSP